MGKIIQMRLQMGSNEMECMQFLCEFWSAIEAFVVTITEENMSHCLHCFYGDLLLATGCHWKEICLVAIDANTSLYIFIICLRLKRLLSTVFTAYLCIWPASCWHTKFWMESDVPRAALLSPRNLGWLWTVPGGDQVWDDSLWTWWLSSAYFPLLFSRYYTLYPHLPSSSDFLTSSAQNLCYGENQVKRQLEIFLGTVFMGHLVLWLRQRSST